MLALTLGAKTEFLSETETETAMKRYWDARLAGDETATLRRVETPGGEVSELARARFAAQDGWLTAQGFAVEPPIYAPGTRCVSYGDERFKTLRAEVEALPAFPDAAGRVRDLMRWEDRLDLRLPLSALTMTRWGTLRADGQELSLTRDVFPRFCHAVGLERSVHFLAHTCPPDLRAENVNRHLARHGDREVILRTRRSGGGPRTAYAVVSTGYTPFDADRVLEAAAEVLSDARVELVYGKGLTATALWMPDHIEDLAAGDIFKSGVRISTDDDGLTAIRVEAVVWRNLCLNLLIIGTGAVQVAKLSHVGSPVRLASAIQAGVEAAREKVGFFLDAWGNARKVKVDPREQLQAWVDGGRLVRDALTTAAHRDRLMDALLAALEKEPGSTLADALNAVTRAAHEGDWDQDFRTQLERDASRLVLLPA